MSKHKLFEYAVLWHPTEREEKEGKRSEIVVPKQSMIAGDDKTVFMKVVKEIPAQYEECLDQVEILIRPF